MTPTELRNAMEIDMSYPTFRSIQAAKSAMRLKRREQWFILEGNQNPKCAHCGKPIHDFSGIDRDGKPKHPTGYQGNLCAYLPEQKRVIPMHYICSWETALDTVFSQHP